MTLRIPALLSAIGLGLVLSGSAFAQNPQHDASGMRDACAADTKQFCGDAKPGMATMQCMQRNQAKMSAGCKAAMAAMRGQGQGGGQISGNGGGMGGGKGQGSGGGKPQK